jgi:hypothetical protein
MITIITFMKEQDMRQRAGFRVLVFALATAACADDLAPPDSPSPERQMPSPSVSTTATGEGFESHVDASRSDAWVHFDFETKAAVSPEDPATSRRWDLAFQRFKVKANGGVSGTAGVEVAIVPDTELAGISAAPASGWLVDQPDGPDMNPDPDTVFNRGEDTWFSYDPTSHLLSPRKQLYVVKTAEDGYFAVQILKYYDQAGTAGFVLFRWKEVTPPSGRQPAGPVADGGAPNEAGMPSAPLPAPAP